MPNPPKDIIQNQLFLSSSEDSELQKYHKPYNEENIVKHKITISKVITT